MLVSQSRRAFVRGLAIAPVTASAIAPSLAEALAPLHKRFEDEALTLVRTRSGRRLSCDRYESAEIAFTAFTDGFFGQNVRATLHQAGAVTKLALCAYLLDVGFADAWSAAHIRQDITKALAYANATGLGHSCANMARLAGILSPYWKWGYPHLIGDPPLDDGGFTPDRVRPLVAALLDRVADVTGHARPMGCERPQGEARP